MLYGDGVVKGVWGTSNGAVFGFAVESQRGGMCVGGVCMKGRRLGFFGSVTAKGTFLIQLLGEFLFGLVVQKPKFRVQKTACTLKKWGESCDFAHHISF